MLHIYLYLSAISSLYHIPRIHNTSNPQLLTPELPEKTLLNMELSYAFFMTITIVVGTLVALFVFREVVVPAAIYFYNYFYYGQEKAEKEALDSMGENHASYALKGKSSSTLALQHHAVCSFDLDYFSDRV